MKLKAIFKNLWLQFKKKKKEIKMTLRPFKLKIGLLRCETVA